jgi:hypothetical protein
MFVANFLAILRPMLNIALLFSTNVGKRLKSSLRFFFDVIVRANESKASTPLSAVSNLPFQDARFEVIPP